MKKYKLDAKEKEILDAVESGLWEPAPLSDKEKKAYALAARSALKKDKHVHIRLSYADL